jgi:hypothetical protein
MRPQSRAMAVLPHTALATGADVELAIKLFVQFDHSVDRAVLENGRELVRAGGEELSLIIFHYQNLLFL